MVAGADSINDMDLLRHGALPDLFGGIRAPSTLGSHLRSFTWGNVRQLEVVNRRMLGELARRTPLLPGRDMLAFIDIDAMQKRVYGTASRAFVAGVVCCPARTRRTDAAPRRCARSWRARWCMHARLSRYEEDGLEGLANRRRQHRPPGPLNGVC
jgi:hypothetical protein